jgi:hypothetical protein
MEGNFILALLSGRMKAWIRSEEKQVQSNAPDTIKATTYQFLPT